MLGISVDSVAVQKAYCSSLGGIPYPMLGDFHPHGQVAEAYGIFNQERGTSLRAIFIVDKAGIVRFRQIYPPGDLPEPGDIVKIMEDNSLE